MKADNIRMIKLTAFDRWAHNFLYKNKTIQKLPLHVLWKIAVENESLHISVNLQPICLFTFS